jgi:hypothetical protein
VRRILHLLTAFLVLGAFPGISRAENTFKPRFTDDLSPAFTRTIETSIEAMPGGLQGWLSEKDVELISGPFLTQIRPDLKGLTPRGYPQGSTWDMSEGLHDRGKVYLPEFKRFEGGSGPARIERIEMVRVSQVLHHEVGHAIDFHQGFSQSTVFVNSFEREKAALLANRPEFNHLESLAYFLTPSIGGRKEAFAELFSAMYNPDPSPESRLMVQSFPETYALVREMVSKLGD